MMGEGYKRWRPQFEAVCDPDRWPIEWLDEEVSSGRMTCVCSEDAAMIVGTKAYPTGKFDMWFPVAAGNMTVLLDGFRPGLEKRAKEMGAIGVVATGRRGWLKALRPFGYEAIEHSTRKAF